MTRPRLAASCRIPAAAFIAIVAVVFSLAIGARPAYAATHIPTTTYTSNTTWTVANSPYVLDGTVTVASGVTLTVNAGVIVKFNGTSPQLLVSGTLLANGTSSSPIYFTSLQDDSVGGDTGGDGPTTGAAGQWSQIKFQAGSTLNQLSNVVLRYGGSGFGNPNATVYVSASNAAAAISDATVTRSATTGISVYQGSASISHSTVTYASKNGIYADHGQVTVDHTTIENNTLWGAYSFINSAPYPAASTFLDNTIDNNGSGGVFLWGATGTPSGSWPYGHRNNIYDNGGSSKDHNQLYNIGLGQWVSVDWRDNYWGSDVHWEWNPGNCGGGTSGLAYTGHLTYPGSTNTAPLSPVNWFSWGVFPNTNCVANKPYIGPSDWSDVPFDNGAAIPDAQLLGADQGPFANSGATLRSDPVDSATGNFVHQTTDLSFPETRGPPMEWTRTYNSLDDTAGPFGSGWATSYGDSLSFNAAGDATFRASDGARFLFTKQANGTYTPATGVTATLTAITGGYELKRKDQLKLTFDSSGKLTALTDRNGQAISLTYTNGKLATATDPVGRTFSFTYDANGKFTQIASSDGRTVSYTYTSGELATVTDVRGKAWTYTYDSHGVLEKETDPLSHTIFRNVYGGDGRLSEQYDGLNNKTTVAWDAATQTNTITDARNNTWKDTFSNNVLQKEVDATGKETQYGHDADLNASAVTGPDGNTTTLTYDSKGNLTHAVAPSSLNADKTLSYDTQNNVTSVTDARGKVTTYTYDANGNNTSITQDGVTVGTYTYNSSGQVTSFKDGRNDTTTYTYDASGNLASETDDLGDKTTYTYDAAGNMTSRVDPRGNIQGADPNQFKWTYTYDGAGRKLTETDPLGNVTTYAYDSAGNQTSVTDADNKTTSYSYDANNQLLTITAPDTGANAYTYDAVGNKITETDPRNKTTSFGYDANNRLASTTTPLGNKTTYAYDVNGNLTKQIDPRGNVQGANPDDYATTYTYDAAGRALTKTDSLGNTTTYTYDKVGNRATVTDANNHTTTYAYNGRNLLASVTAPGGAETTYTYDNAGNVASRTDPKTHQTTYAYDGANRLTSMTLPLSRQWTYAYDAAGNRTQVVDANGNATQMSGDGTTTYSYDRAGRLTGIDYSDSTPDVTYSYDGVGNRTQMTDGATQTYTYDSVNRLTQVTRGTDTFAYTYDLAGNITRRTYPDSTIVDYTYDDDSRLATVVSGGQTTTYGYDPAGNLTQTTLPSGNGYVEDRTYDRAGRVTRVKTSNPGSTLSDFTYTLDPVGNPTKVVRDGNLPGTTTYTYDARDRLTEVCFQASCPGGSDPFIRWTYDSVGNRLTEARPSGTTNYSYDAADELTAAASTSYSYDENGNETAAGSQSFSYDLANRMLSASSGGTTTTYAYDGDNNRLQTTVGSQVTKFVWDSARSLPQLVLEREGAGAVIRRYVVGNRRISVTTGSNTFYYHYDSLGSIANVTSSNGATEWTYAYEPFGTTRTETQNDPSAPSNPFKFAGEQADATGLYYLRARQYDAAVGRFTATDPAQTCTALPYASSYVYASNRPTVYVDPTGRAFEPAQNQWLSYAVSPDSTNPPKYNFAYCDAIGVVRKDGLQVGVQVNPRGTVQWGVALYGPDTAYYPGTIWNVTAKLFVPNRRRPYIDPKIGYTYNPHGSFKAELIRVGTLFHLDVEAIYDDPKQTITWTARVDCIAK